MTSATFGRYVTMFAITSFFVSSVLSVVTLLDTNPDPPMRFSVTEHIVFAFFFSARFLPFVVLFGIPILWVCHYFFDKLNIKNLLLKILVYGVFGIGLTPILPYLMKTAEFQGEYILFNPYNLISILSVPFLGVLHLLLIKHRD